MGCGNVWSEIMQLNRTMSDIGVLKGYGKESPVKVSGQGMTMMSFCKKQKHACACNRVTL